jgi:hypothetical protein
VVRYVQFQLLVSGHKGTDIFTPDALARISELSAGVPRIINRLCSDALMKAFALGKTVIDRQLLEDPIDYTEIARSLDNVVNMDSFLPPLIPSTPVQTHAAVPPAHAQTPVPPRPESAARDPFASAIHSWLQNRATIWTGTAGELLSGLRDLDNSAFASMTPKELARQLEASLQILESHGIHAELRPNANGPRMIALRLVCVPAETHHDEAPASAEAQRAAG